MIAICFQTTRLTGTLKGVIFVVDSADRERASEAKTELHKLMDEGELRDSILLIFANKQDLPNAMSPSELSDKLELGSLKQKTWNIQKACASNGDGLYEGLEWLSRNLKKR